MGFEIYNFIFLKEATMKKILKEVSIALTAVILGVSTFIGVVYFKDDFKKKAINILEGTSSELTDYKKRVNQRNGLNSPITLSELKKIMPASMELYIETQKDGVTLIRPYRRGSGCIDQGGYSNIYSFINQTFKGKLKTSEYNEKVWMDAHGKLRLIKESCSAGGYEVMLFLTTLNDI
jgi:hypothetical protein